MDINVDHPEIVQVTARGGYSRYYTFNFLTVGGEAALQLPLSGLQVVAGLEVFSVKRKPPPDVQIAEGIYSEWNQVVPINVGALYGIRVSRLEPYFGADLVVAPYYNDGDKQYFALGARARGGLDVMIVPHFGVNANVAVGAWSGSKWEDLEGTLGNVGPLPQVSLGLFVGI